MLLHNAGLHQKYGRLYGKINTCLVDVHSLPNTFFTVLKNKEEIECFFMRTTKNVINSSKNIVFPKIKHLFVAETVCRTSRGKVIEDFFKGESL